MSVKQSKQPWQRVGVFLDSQNLFYTAKYLYKARVNFNTLLEDVVGDRRLIRAIAYVIKTEDGDESSFFDALEKIGFDVKAKPLQIFYGGNKKGDWDIGIAMDIVRMASKLDVVILLSGDGDFVDLVEYAKAAGCRTEAAAFGRSSSSKLKEEVDEFIDLDGNDRYLLQKGKVRLPSDYRKSGHDGSADTGANVPSGADPSRNGGKQSSHREQEKSHREQAPQNDQGTSRRKNNARTTPSSAASGSSDRASSTSGSSASASSTAASSAAQAPSSGSANTPSTASTAPKKPVVESVSEKVKIMRGGATIQARSSGSRAGSATASRSVRSSVSKPASVKTSSRSVAAKSSASTKKSARSRKRKV